jgi:DNA-binding transcriptional ArsR family regulator
VLELWPPLGVPRVWIHIVDMERSVAAWALGEWHTAQYSAFPPVPANRFATLSPMTSTRPPDHQPPAIRIVLRSGFRQNASLLKALADPVRLRLVALLLAGPRNVTDLSGELFDVTKGNVSHDLGVLRHARVVQAQKQGRRVLYRLHPEVVGTVRRGD